VTAGTTTPYRSDLRPGHDGFTRLLRAEWTKFRTVRGWVIGMLVAGLVTVLIGLFGVVGSSGSCNVSACTTLVGPGGEAVTDQFFFVHRPLAGDGSITASVTSLTGLIPSFGQGQESPGMKPGIQPWAKAGIIMKASTQPGSPYAAIMVTGSHGVRMQYDYTHDIAGLPGGVSPASPRWLRLTRSGGTITGYDSADGTHWSVVGTVHLTGLPSTVQAGLFTASPQYTRLSSHFVLTRGAGGPTQATAVFDQVSVEGGQPNGTWHGEEVGASSGGIPGPAVGYQESGGAFTISGSGDIAPALSGEQAGEGDTVENFLVGAFAGLIPVIVVGTMFITAEYRRGLIRTTLAASPRRGRVLLAKAIVLCVVTFVIGLAAAAAVVAIDTEIMHANGSPVLPVPFRTELRIVVGTAGLLAVAAVLALAIGAIVRRSAGAVTAVIVAIVLPYILATSSVLPPGTTQWLMRITPDAAFAIQQSIPQYPQVDTVYIPSLGYYPLTPWAGFAVLCAWAALALILAAFLLRRRDA
jgi:ABC-type transport system involved in multi-copper enzyme maturation permease subunit